MQNQRLLNIMDNSFGGNGTGMGVKVAGPGRDLTTMAPGWEWNSQLQDRNGKDTSGNEREPVAIYWSHAKC